MIPADRIKAVCDALLDAVVAYYAEQNVTLPDRRYVANGLPAIDCEQLTVFCESTVGITGTPLGENPTEWFRDAGHAMRAGIFAVTLNRCVPVLDDDGDPPPVTDEDTSSAEIYGDAVMVLNALIAAEEAGQLPEHGSIVFRGWTNDNAEGGIGGGTLRVSISLAGL